jgi:ATP-dependent DNA ligase
MLNQKTELPTLFSRSSTGAVLEWDIEIEGDKFRTITGQQGGNKITSKWTVAKPKNIGQANATTADEQAYTEAVAKWKKKIKREGYWEDIKDIDKTPRFIEPMLAHKLRDHPEKPKFPCMVDKKYNGGRVVAVAEGLFTRKGEQYLAMPHIIEALAALFEKHPDLFLDGEAYNHDLRFKLNELMSIIRTTKGKKLNDDLFRRSEQIVRLYVYDGYGFDGITADTGNLERRKALKDLLKDIPYVVWVPYRVANTLDEVYEIYGGDVKEGYEGSMIRNFDAPYEHKRSYNLLKVKPEDDDEGVIVAINEGTGNTSGLAATATLKWKGKEFEATFMGAVETRQQILKEADKWIGQTVTFLYNGLTGLGTPNYARIDPDNCFQGKK